MEARYDILTWDPASGQYSQQEGMHNPSLGVPWQGLLRALRELKTWGYTCHRGPTGSDPAVLVERVDDVELEWVFAEHREKV